MARTKIDGHDQIQEESIDGHEIQNGTICLEDMNQTSTGSAVVVRVLTSTGLLSAYTGAAPGSGTVTIALSTSAGLTAVTHRGLDQLVHNIAETSYYEVTRSGTQITKEIWWTTAGKTIKIREIDYTYSGAFVSQLVTKQYDALGNLVIGETLTETITRAGVNITSVASVLS